MGIETATIEIKSGVYKMFWEGAMFYYIGGSCNIGRRTWNHNSRAKAGIHKNRHIQEIYNTHGKPKYIILEECLKSDLNKREQYYLDLNFNNQYCLNISPTAGTPLGVKRTDEYKDKIRKSVTQETRVKIGLAKRGKKYPKLSESLKKVKRTDEFKNKLRTTLLEYSVRSKIVLDIETGVFYRSASEISRLYGVDRGYLTDRLSGRKANNTKWVYA